MEYMEYMRIRMIGIDLDGTLLTMDKELTEASREALERAMAAGIEVVPVTGRPLAGVPAEVLELPGIRYIITSNGANTYDLSLWEGHRAAEPSAGNGSSQGRAAEAADGLSAEAVSSAGTRSGREEINAALLIARPVPREAVLRMSHLPHETVRRILEAAEGEDVIREIFVRGVGYHDARTQKMLEERFSFRPPILNYINRSREIVPDFEAVLSDASSHVENISLMFPSQERRDGVFEKLKKIRGENGERILHVLLPWVTDLEVTHILADKWLAVQDLAGRLGIAAGEIMTLGDGDNDRPMLQHAGLGVAMGNAPDFVKKTADRIALDNEHDGAAAAIREILDQ